MAFSTGNPIGSVNLQLEMPSMQESGESDRTSTPGVSIVLNYGLTHAVGNIENVQATQFDVHAVVTGPKFSTALDTLQLAGNIRNPTSLLVVLLVAPQLQNSVQFFTPLGAPLTYSGPVVASNGSEVEQREALVDNLVAHATWAVANLGFCIQVGVLSSFRAHPVGASFFTMVLFLSVLLAFVVLGTRSHYPASVRRGLLLASSGLAVCAAAMKPFLSWN